MFDDQVTYTWHSTSPRIAVTRMKDGQFLGWIDPNTYLFTPVRLATRQETDAMLAKALARKSAGGC